MSSFKEEMAIKLIIIIIMIITYYPAKLIAAQTNITLQLYSVINKRSNPHWQILYHSTKSN